MPLFWIVHEIDGKRRIFTRADQALAQHPFELVAIAVGGLPITQQCRVSRAAVRGAAAVGMPSIGRVLSDREIQEVLDRMS